MKDIILRYLADIKNEYQYLLYLKNNIALKNCRLNQKKDFYRVRDNFKKKYNLVNKPFPEEFTTPLWKMFNDNIANELLPKPSISFLKKRYIRYTMFTGKNANHTQLLSLLEKKFDKKVLYALLKEDLIGNPLIINKKYLTSYNTLQTCYNLTIYENTLKKKISSYNTIVEWGGGYGNLAKIIRRWQGSKTYIIIDTPIISCLQWLYLSSVFSESDVKLITNGKDKISPGKINLVSLPFLNVINTEADLFISTWALSESSKYSQNYVFKKNFFGAKHLLLAFDPNSPDFKDSGRVKLLSKKFGAKVFEIKNFKGNYYAFK